jgi:hypothetical protein
MKKTNNNKLKILIFFFIGLGSTNQTMEDNQNHKRTHSQMEDNDQDDHSESRKRIKLDNENSINTMAIAVPTEDIAPLEDPEEDSDISEERPKFGNLLNVYKIQHSIKESNNPKIKKKVKNLNAMKKKDTNGPNQIIRGFVNKLQDADMTQERLNIGSQQLTNISDLFPSGNTIGENSMQSQILNPNILYTMAYKRRQMGPFFPCRVVKTTNYQQIEAEKEQVIQAVDFTQLRKVFADFIQFGLRNKKTKKDAYCFFETEECNKLIVLLKNKIEDVNDPFFDQLFEWVKESPRCPIYEPNKDLSKIKESHKNNLFEDFIQTFKKQWGIKFNIDETNDSLTIYKEKTFKIDQSTGSLTTDKEQIEVTYSINDGLTMIFFNRILQEFNCQIKEMEDFLLCFKSTKQVFSQIVTEDLFENANINLEDQTYNDNYQILQYLQIKMKPEKLKIFNKKKTLDVRKASQGLSVIKGDDPAEIDPLFLLYMISFLEGKVADNGIYFPIQDHVTLEYYTFDEMKRKRIKPIDEKEERAIKILQEGDSLLLALSGVKFIEKINTFNQLIRQTISPQSDKIFLDDQYNNHLHRIMDFFRVHNVNDLLFKDMKEANLMSIKNGYESIFDILDNYEELYYDNPRGIPDITDIHYDVVINNNSNLPSRNSFSFWLKNREVRPDVIISSLFYNASPEDKVNLNLEHSILAATMTYRPFFKKFPTTFKHLYGKILINYSQYNMVDPENPQFNLGSRNIIDWERIFNIIFEKLINKYPNGFSYNPLIDPKISEMELKQAHGEFLLHMNQLLVENLVKGFSETDDSQEGFATNPKDQYLSIAEKELLKINLGAIKQNIKAVVYWDNYMGSLDSNDKVEGSDKSGDGDCEMINGENIPNLQENSDNVLVESMNNFPLNDNVYADEVMENQFPDSNMQGEMINTCGPTPPIHQEEFSFPNRLPPKPDNSYQVYKDSLTKICDFYNEGNFNSKKMIEFVNNQLNLALSKIRISAWSEDSENLEVFYIEEYRRMGYENINPKKFIKHLTQIKVLKDLLKQCIVQGLSSKDQDYTAVTIYTTDPMADAIFGFEPRKPDGVKPIKPPYNVDFIQQQMAISLFNYSLSKSLPMDVNFINDSIKQKYIIENSHVEFYKFFRVAFQGSKQYLSAVNKKFNNKNPARANKIFSKLFVSFEVYKYIFDISSISMNSVAEIAKDQMRKKIENQRVI